jgi:chloramphenicol-sensitive protein RarD
VTSKRGYLSAIAAYVGWGLFPLYWGLLRPASSLEMLAHRVVWSVLFVLAVIAVARGWRRLWTLARPRVVGLLGLAAALLGVNWAMYIYGVIAGRVVETSLGYFITPLVTVLLGVVVLGERLRAAQWIAVTVGTVAVLVLTVDYGHIPYLAVGLAATFSLYGLIKKRLSAPAIEGLALESALLAVPAAGYLVALGVAGTSTFGHVSAGHTILMILAGPVTAIPLLAFASAANQIPLSAIGLLQYIAPILQLACGVLILGEPLPPVRLAGFALVWAALAVFTWDGLRRLRATARASTTPVQTPVSA